jgi:hypothetical protein
VIYIIILINIKEKIMRKYIILSFTFFILFGCSKKLSSQIDEFWNGTQYRMELNDVKELFPDWISPDMPLTLATGSKKLLIIPEFIFGNEKFQVSLFFIDEKLEQVNLELINVSRYSKRDLENIYSNIKPILIKEYGKKLGFENSSSSGKRIEWDLSNKVVSLSYMVYDDIEYKSLLIVFLPDKITYDKQIEFQKSVPKKWDEGFDVLWVGSYKSRATADYAVVFDLSSDGTYKLTYGENVNIATTYSGKYNMNFSGGSSRSRLNQRIVGLQVTNFDANSITLRCSWDYGDKIERDIYVLYRQ